MECPPAPMKGQVLTYNHITSEWEAKPVRTRPEIECPPAPKKKSIQSYNSFAGKWEFR